MRLAGPLHPDEKHLVGQAFLVARMRDRVQRRFILETERRVQRLLDARHAGHVCRQPGERRMILLETIRQSLARRRLTVLVHSLPSNRAMLRYLHGEQSSEGSLATNEALLLVPAGQVWEGRRPDPTATLEFVDELQTLGNRIDHRHVQLISDANHLFSRDSPHGSPLFALEEWWNRAKVTDVNLACLYRSADLVGVDPAAIERLHPLNG